MKSFSSEEEKTQPKVIFWNIQRISLERKLKQYDQRDRIENMKSRKPRERSLQ